MPYLVPLPSVDAFWQDNLYQLRTRPASAVGAADIAQWESRHGVRLPEELAALYRQRNGGVSDWLNAVVGVRGAVSLHAHFGNHWSPVVNTGTLRGATLGEVSDGIDFGADGASYRHALGADADRLWTVASYGSSKYLLLDYRSSSTEPAVTVFDDGSRFAGDDHGLHTVAATVAEFLAACRREIAHPLRVWSVDGSAVGDLADRFTTQLSAVAEPPARMAIDGGWEPQYGQDHLGLPDPYLAPEFQPDFGDVRQFHGGELGTATLRVYANGSRQHTRAERFAGDTAVLVSLMLPVVARTPLPPATVYAVEEAIDAGATPWRRWLDTDSADFVADDDLLSP